MKSHARRRRSSLSLFATACGLAACGGELGSNGAGGIGSETLRNGIEVVTLSSGVRGPRLVPESVDLERSFGVEPGGGLRGIAAGVRVVSYASGAVLTAPDRLTTAPASITVLPDRLGGGALFAIGDTLFRSEKWLARAEAVFKAPAPIKAVWVGLDRVVLRMPNGALIAVNPVSGAPLDLGALPPSPAITAYAALDGFRAVALADLRGVVATTDAGGTWRTVPIPAEPRELVAVGDTLTVLGVSGRDGPVFEVRPEGDFARVTTSVGDKDKDRGASGSSSAPPDATRAGANFATTPAAVDAAKMFGQRPLALAVADGIPLADGSALVAHAGALARVRLVDGAILDLARDAFPLRSAKCHGIVIGEPNGAGFVCGEPRGRTHVYRYLPARRRLDLVMAFDLPRVILPGGNGAIAVRGRCAEDAPSPTAVPGLTATEVTYCVRSATGATREQVLTASVENARVVPLRDGRLAVIVPPRGDIVGGHVTIVGNDAPVTTPLVFDEPADAARKVVAQGMWLDGFEERSPGVLGGWVEHAGTVLGIEINANGHARHGVFVRDIGNSVVVAGRFGLGWTGAQRGFETTDGGLTWRAIDLPDKLDPTSSSMLRSPAPRGCGPAGCVLAGWIRVGWGEVPAAPPSTPNALTVLRPTAVSALELTCEVASTRAGTSAASNAAHSRGASSTAGARSSTRGPMTMQVIAGNGMYRTSGGDFTPFYGVAPPTRRPEDVEAQYEVQELADHQRNVGPLARAYVWGAKGLEWDATSRWLVRWTSPFASSSDVFSTPVAAPPRVVIEASRFAAGGQVRPMQSVTIAPSDDPRHALLVSSRALTVSGFETLLVMLDDGRAPVEVRRADGEPFTAVHSALRIEGRWFVATDPAPSEPAAAVIWEIEAGVARELARIPRVDPTRSSGSAPFRLARRDGETTIGLVVDAQPNADGRPARKWVIGVDTTSGRLGELEPLGGVEYDGRTVTPCTGDEGGWVLDMPLATPSIRVSGPGRPAITLRSGYGRVRLGRGKACVERLAAQYDGSAEDLPRGSLGPMVRSERVITIGVLTNGVRQELRCRAPAP